MELKTQKNKPRVTGANSWLIHNTRLCKTRTLPTRSIWLHGGTVKIRGKKIERGNKHLG